MPKIRFESQPDGATVLVNDQQLTDQGSPLLTPCDYAMSCANPVDVTFRKRGYKDAVLRQSFPIASKPFSATLEAVTVTDRTLSLSAATNTAWTPTGVHAKKGGHVRITANGTWSCASDGEMVDANGYPDNDANVKYYMDPLQNPRISTRANYGQLLARILPDGEIVAIGKQGSFVTPVDGEVALTINETPSARKDNHGTIKARVFVDP